ncbi:MAG: DUF2188 domain-containing protein [Pseudomonadota bacterium]|nr:DUF2188 domain-containing protein [Pseudomonadota bacterium]
MASVAYVVSPEDRSWKLTHEGHRAGRFPVRDQALETAIELAKEAHGVGHDAVVVLEDETGRVREAWRQEHGSGAA